MSKIEELEGYITDLEFDLTNYVLLANETANEIKDLQERLAISQLNEVRLREALETCHENSFGTGSKEQVFNSYMVEQALSTPPNRADLDAYVEAQMGEPVTWKVEPRYEDLMDTSIMQKLKKRLKH